MTESALTLATNLPDSFAGVPLDLNRLARIDRIIDKEQTLYSVDTNREAGYIEVIRNY